MGSSGGGGGGGDSETTVRYAPYIEEKHETFLDQVESYVNAHKDISPYTGYDPIDIRPGFLGVGYALSDFPSLYDMFGKFMAGLDICDLSNQIFEDTVNSTTINDLVAAESNLLSDHIETRILPKFKTGMRDINSVLTSSYIIGEAIIADSGVKAIEKYSSELRYRMIPVALDKWKTHLTWNNNVVSNYASILQLFTAARIDTQNQALKVNVRHDLWPFTVLDYERAALGAMQGALNTNTATEGDSPSALAGAVGGALSGAAMGSVFGVPGAIAGGVMGAAASFL